MKRVAATLAALVASPLLAGAAAAAVPMEHGLIEGLDGGLYQPYKASVVRKTQQALKQKGLYSHEVDGVLDEATMRALGDYQAQHGLVASGVPTPDTRRALFGS
jgi:peptidoglycan hydrolase-like protein with peptidoglycan-binding domain